MFRNSFDEFKREQDDFRKQLEDMTRYREAFMARRNGKKTKSFFLNISII